MNSKKIREFVLSLGITPDLLGYEYIISAVELLFNQNEKAMMKIYEQVAEIHNTTRSKVQRAIKHAITTILNCCGGYESLSKTFHCNLLSETLPTSKFLWLCVETLKYNWEEQNDA